MPGSTDNHLPQAWLDITCTDRITGEPVVGAAVIVVDLRQFMAGKVVNTGSTKGKDTVTDASGFTKARILAHHRYGGPLTCAVQPACHTVPRVHQVCTNSVLPQNVAAQRVGIMRCHTWHSLSDCTGLFLETYPADMPR